MAIKARIIPKFPARVLGGTGITVSKSGGVYTFSIAFEDLAELGSISAGDRDNTLIPSYNEDTGVYRLVSIDTFLAAISAGLDATLLAIAGLTGAADKGIYFTGVDTASLYDLTAGGRALAGLTGAADTFPYWTGAGSASTAAVTSFIRTLLDDAAATDAATTLGLGTGDSPQFTAVNVGHASDSTITRVSAGVLAVEGSNILLASGLGSITQAYDATLASIAALGTAADRVAYTTGVDTWAETPLTSFGRSLIDDANAAAGATTLGLGTGDSPEFTAVNIGHASDTTITRSSAGVIAVEGNPVLLGSTGATDNAALRANGAGGVLIQDSPLIIADTTGALLRSGNGGIPVQGTNTNDNAAAGYVGEYISSTIAVGSAISLTSDATADITSISLTAGDWDVRGTVAYVFSVGSSRVSGGLGTTSASLATLPTQRIDNFLTVGAGYVAPVGTWRLSLAATTTVYLHAFATFSSGTGTAYGHISARRVR